MATHSNILARENPWTEDPGGLHTIHGVARVGHDLVTKQQQQVMGVELEGCGVSQGPSCLLL